MYIIGMNGPPRSGKDSVSQAIFKSPTLNLPVAVRSCSTPMRLAAFAMLGLTYSDETYELIKDVPQEIFQGASVREWMIQFSETFVKPTFGHDFWSMSIALQFDPWQPGLLLVPDIGFQQEPDTFVNRFGPNNFLLVQLTREGKDWGNDSRRYVSAPNLLAVHNQDIEISAEFVLRYAAQNLGWNL